MMTTVLEFLTVLVIVSTIIQIFILLLAAKRAIERIGFLKCLTVVFTSIVVTHGLAALPVVLVLCPIVLVLCRYRGERHKHMMYYMHVLRPHILEQHRRQNTEDSPQQILDEVEILPPDGEGHLNMVFGALVV